MGKTKKNEYRIPLPLLVSVRLKMMDKIGMIEGAKTKHLKQARKRKTEI